MFFLSKEEGQEEILLEGLLHGIEIVPQYLGDALHEFPLLLEGLMQYHICGMQVLRATLIIFYPVRPVQHLLSL